MAEEISKRLGAGQSKLNEGYQSFEIIREIFLSTGSFNNGSNPTSFFISSYQSGLVDRLQNGPRFYRNVDFR
jgi:hypothetical protein